MWNDILEEMDKMNNNMSTIVGLLGVILISMWLLG